MAITITSTAAWPPTASRTIPLELSRLLNEMASDHAFTFTASNQEVTSFSFEPTTSASKIVPHSTAQVTDISMPSQTVTPTETPSQHESPTLQSYVPPQNTAKWYEAAWVGPFTWLLAIYCCVSAFILAVLFYCRVLNWRLELDLTKLPAVRPLDANEWPYILYRDQQDAYTELQAREVERRRTDEIVLENLRVHGIL
ncbi:hypothetical protein M409DRAFT_29003 [Zasmidium cellare ATCC 36951]|uniref:Uncharacterized protein n=1 Tax=Zasmidium cellare ATCC 36951 TaxID=1080233 RepID=A0A6A6C0V8_ZASCE|nr:uncharacterized protein M409DRAFT_29003 [Zasmidium cellare ATCC 36951]KAF2160615.1 hypothetical protein M409DRAFT_29003 [Zasmidium cellare ATCC 36951]